MKKIFFTIAAALIFLSLIILVSCRAEPFEINNPDRPWTPFQGQVVDGIPEGAFVSEQLVILRATSVYADDFVWRRDDVVLQGRNHDTLHIAASGFFPDAPRITVAGRNVSGVGEFSDSIMFSFVPWEAPRNYGITGDRRDTLLVPGDTIIGDVYINVCPTPYVTLTANIWQATMFQWYLDGQPIENMDGINSRTLRVWYVFDSLRNDYVGSGSGVYTVRGWNAIDMVGTGLSDPVTVEWTECARHILAGTWSVTARRGNMEGMPSMTWNEVLIMDDGNPDIVWLSNVFNTPGVRAAVATLGNVVYFPNYLVIGSTATHDTIQFVVHWTSPTQVSLDFDANVRVNAVVASDFSSFYLPNHPTSTFNEGNRAIALVTRPRGNTGLDGLAWIGGGNGIIRAPAFTRTAAGTSVATPQKSSNYINLQEVTMTEGSSR